MTLSHQLLINCSYKELIDFNSGIYLIKLVEGDKNVAYSRFISFKKLKQRSCAKVNSHSSEVLYVGSSTTNIRKRIGEHLGEGNASTYSLHLKYWLPDQFKIEIEVRNYSESREVIQLIEDDLSYRHSPAFGKKGSNNK